MATIRSILTTLSLAAALTALCILIPLAALSLGA